MDMDFGVLSLWEGERKVGKMRWWSDIYQSSHL